MRIIKKIALGLIVVVALLAIVGMFLPRNISVARSIEINAPAAKIYPHFANLGATVPWSPWLHHDPETKLEFNDIAEGVGAVMSWASDHKNVGSGTMTVLEAEQDKSLLVELDFGDMGGGMASWDLTEVNGVTTTTWGMETDMGAGPVGRWMGLMMDKWIGADYQKGLQNLKELVESQ
jgi:hypothetical protein